MDDSTQNPLIEQYRQALFHPEETTGLEEPLHTQLVQQGILLALFDQGDPAAITAMLDIVRRHAWDKLREQAFGLLAIRAEKGNPSARQAICDLFLLDGDERAREAALAHDYLPAGDDHRAAFYLLMNRSSDLRAFDPQFTHLTAAFRSLGPAVQDRLLRSAAAIPETQEWGQLIEALSRPTSQKLAALVNDLPGFSSEIVRQLSLRLLVEQASAGDEAMKETILDLFLQKTYAPAREAAVSHHFLPNDAPRRALFLFLTDQWEAYQALDFNQSLLSSVYAQSNALLRRRIIAQTRRAGRVDWMQTISRGRRVRWLGEMNDTDWFSVLETLGKNEKWADLWRLAQIAPPVWSVPILLRLQKAGWAPASDLEQRGYANLMQLAAGCAGVSIEVHTPRCLYASPLELTCLIVSPGGTQLAAGTNTGSILIWKLIEGGKPLVLTTVPGPVWSLAYSPDGQLLASGHGDHAIRVWDAHSTHHLKTLEGHAAMVRSLQVMPDNRLLVSASFDGTLRTWRFPLGPQQKTLKGSQAEIFCLAVSPDGRLAACGGADRDIHLWSLPRGETLPSISGHTDTITCLDFTPLGDYLISAGRDQSIRIWSVPEGFSTARLEGHRGPVTGLAVHPNGRLLASAGFDGQILLWNLPEGDLIQSLEKQPGSIASLRITSDGNTLVSASRDGQVLLWDLRPLLWIRLPIERVSAEDLRLVKVALEDPRLAKSERTWFEYCLAQIQWRRQFDIELEEPRRPIQVGEYDIEIGEAAQ